MQLKNVAALAAILSFSLTPTLSFSQSAPVPAYNNTTLFGNFLRPFISTSPWNSKPTNPVFDDFVIPTDRYNPFIGPSDFSTSVFEAKASDLPVTIYADPTTRSINDVDALEEKQSITIPRWPTNAIGAKGGDGHCDVVDSVTGIVHSFWQLRKQADGRWTAVMYAWTKITGSGWGDPAHYYQGARAAAVAPIGGLIRKHEIADGKANYEHALAMSLTFSALSPNPAYIYPATNADQYAFQRNFGSIPEGALLMLPPDFDTSILGDTRLRKIANTLKLYGAYVVDQNEGTPFSIYVENGSAFDLNDGTGNGRVTEDVHTIRAALRMVKSATFVSGLGAPVQPPANPNLLSMRGDWNGNLPQGGHSRDVGVTYDTWQQALVFQPSAAPVTVKESNGVGISKVTWAQMKANDRMKLTATTTGGGDIASVRVYNQTSE